MVETLASYLAMIKQKSKWISNPNWGELGIINAIIFFDIKTQKA